MTEFVEIEITCPDAASAEAIARACVGARLAACANIRPGLRSLYRWQGKVEDDAEVGLSLKTRAALFEAVCAEVTRLHPYDVPAIVALPMAAVAPPFADWLRAETDA